MTGTSPEDGRGTPTRGERAAALRDGGLRLESKSVLVTGAASGIGAAVASRLVACGANVVAFDRERFESARELAGVIGLVDGERVVGHLGDVTRQSDVDDAVMLATRRFGRLDAVVNCAGVTDDGVVWKLTDAQWQRVLDVNLTGSFRVVRAAVPVLRTGGGGSIVLVSSVNALRGKFGQSNYAASKAGVIALAKSVAQETGAFQIRVNAVAPGYVKTPMTAKIPPKFVEQALSETPLGRLAEPVDVADAILFLCSPLSRHITGTVLRVDGGQVTAG